MTEAKKPVPGLSVRLRDWKKRAPLWKRFLANVGLVLGGTTVALLAGTVVIWTIVMVFRIFGAALAIVLFIVAIIAGIVTWAEQDSLNIGKNRIY